jgi:hypothetical protein
VVEGWVRNGDVHRGLPGFASSTATTPFTVTTGVRMRRVDLSGKLHLV